MISLFLSSKEDSGRVDVVEGNESISESKKDGGRVAVVEGNESISEEQGR
jgi:hypothetical protein